MLDKSKMTPEELKRYEKFEDEFFDVYTDADDCYETEEEKDENRIFWEKVNEEWKKKPKKVKEKISIELFDERICRAREVSTPSERRIKRTNEWHNELFGCDYIPYKYYKKKE